VILEHGVEGRRIVYAVLTKEGHNFREELRSQLGTFTKKMTESDIKIIQTVVNKITINRVDYKESRQLVKAVESCE